MAFTGSTLPTGNTKLNAQGVTYDAQRENIKNLAIAQKNMQNAVIALGIGSGAGLYVVAQGLQAELKKTVSGAGTGVVYPGKSGKGPHQASSPGDPPAKDEGTLLRSIVFRPTSPSAITSAGHVEIGTDLNYAAWLEFGTRKMARRPWMRETILRVGEDLVQSEIGKSALAAQKHAISKAKPAGGSKSGGS